MIKASREADFIWEVLNQFLLCGNKAAALDLVASLYEKNYQFEGKVEDLLLRFWSKHEEGALLELALLVAQRFWFDAERHVLIVAQLVERELLDIRSAFHLLALSPSEFSTLSDPVQRVLNIAWLVNQDSKDGFMDVEQDTLLADALAQLVAGRYSTCEKATGSS